MSNIVVENKKFNVSVEDKKSITISININKNQDSKDILRIEYDSVHGYLIHLLDEEYIKYFDRKSILLILTKVLISGECLFG